MTMNNPLNLTKHSYSIWTPESREDAWEIAKLLSKGDERQAHDLILCHAAFGHHYDYDMGLVLVNTSSIKGRPTIKADALAGICRSTGNVQRLHVVHLDNVKCVVECQRRDTGVLHTYTFTWQMAEQMNLTTNQNWRRMPLQMLRARAIAMACRAVWPDAVSGIYTSDEIADSLDMSDRDRFEATARSLGADDLKYDSRPPAPVQAIQPPVQVAQPSASVQVVQTQAARKLYDIDTEQDLLDLCESHNIDEAQIKGLVRAKRLTLSDMNPTELYEFFYSYCLHAVTRQMHNIDLTNWWELTDSKLTAIDNAFKTQYKCLSALKPVFYGPRITQPAWAETMRHVCILTDDTQMVEGLNVLRQMRPDDWSAYDYVKSLGNA